MQTEHGQGNEMIRLSAALVLGGALLSGPLAMLIVALVAPQPDWTGVDAFLRYYHPIQSLPYLLGFILLSGFVLFTASCHAVATPDLRFRTSAALIFTGIYASMIFTNYTIQLGYIPRIVESRSDVLSALTMANPASFAWFLEMYGYAAMGVATWLVAPIFQGGNRARVIRVLLIGNGVVSIAGAACTALYDRWVFSLAGLISFASWNLLVALCFLLIVLPSGYFIVKGTRHVE